MYDFDLLATLLKRVGFVEVQRASFQNGDVPDVALLDNRPEESLYVEASKP